MAESTVVAPPQLVGTTEVAAAFGLSAHRIRRLAASGADMLARGYIGKVNGRHIWNGSELFASLFASPQSLRDEIARVKAGDRSGLWCSVNDCEDEAQFLELCHRHLRELHRTFGNAEKSYIAVYRLLAMCQWVVERNAHLSLPAGWDPWSGRCMSPGCGNRTDLPGNRSSPLCRDCSRKFWGGTHRTATAKSVA